MKYGNHTHIRVTKHAHEQYNSRVEQIDFEALNELCQQQFAKRDIQYSRKQWIRLGGVWWVTEYDAPTLTFITCYGKTDFNIPKAIGWATRLNDRIRLDGTY